MTDSDSLLIHKATIGRCFVVFHLSLSAQKPHAIGRRLHLNHLRSHPDKARPGGSCHVGFSGVPLPQISFDGKCICVRYSRSGSSGANHVLAASLTARISIDTHHLIHTTHNTTHPNFLSVDLFLVDLPSPQFPPSSLWCRSLFHQCELFYSTHSTQQPVESPHHAFPI